MARLPYTNFHDINLDWIIKRVMKAFTPDNPPPYPVKSVNGKTGAVNLSGFDIDYSDQVNVPVSDCLDFLAEECSSLWGDKISWPENAGSPGDVLTLDSDQTPVWSAPDPGATDYDDLENRPEINSVTLTGDQSGADLGLLDAPAVAGAAGDVLQSNGDNTQSWVNLDNKYAAIITDTASGPIASFPDGANNLPVLSLIADIVPIQAGTGDPSPSNPRAISGRAGMSVYQTGNNICDEIFEIGGINSTDGQNNTTNTTIRTENFIPVIPGETYYPYCGSFIGSSKNLRARFYDINYNYIGYVNKSGNSVEWNKNTGSNILQPPNNAYYLRFELQTEYGTIYKNDISINYPSSDNLYHTYNGKSPILEAWGDIAGTVYGGTLDIVSGVLTVTHKFVDLGELTWNKNSSWGFYANIPSDCPNYTSGVVDILCELYKTVNSTNAPGTNEITINSNYIRVGDLSYATGTDFGNAMQNVKMTYPLVTPVTYQLTPQEVKTIFGINNIYSDSGDCTVTYRADTKLFILKVV